MHRHHRQPHRHLAARPRTTGACIVVAAVAVMAATCAGVLVSESSLEPAGLPGAAAAQTALAPVASDGAALGRIGDPAGPLERATPPPSAVSASALKRATP